jgi:hypothetical protein
MERVRLDELGGLVDYIQTYHFRTLDPSPYTRGAKRIITFKLQSANNFQSSPYTYEGGREGGRVGGREGGRHGWARVNARPPNLDPGPI